MKISRKRICIIGIDAVIWFILLLIYFSIYNTEIVPDNWAKNVSVIAIFLLVLQLLQMRFLKITPYDFVFWYVPMQFLFYFGRIILYWLDLDDQIAWRLFYHYSMKDIYHSSYFTLCFFQGIYVGLLMNKGGHKNTDKDRLIKEIKYSPKAMAFSGIAICIVSSPFLLLYSVKTIIAQRMGGYVAIAESSGFVQSFYLTFFAGIILIVFSTFISKRVTKIICIAYSIYGIIYMILSGDRRQTAITLIVLALCYVKSYDIRLKSGVVLTAGVIGYSLLCLLSAISAVRIYGITVQSVLEELKNQFEENNLIVQIFGEFGGTFFTIVNATSHYPADLPYVAGRTYLASILIIVPTLFTYLFPEFFGHAQIAPNMEAIDGNPCGGSLGQDLYANFGSVGIVGVIILGWILGRLVRKEKRPVSIDYAKYYVKFYILINLVRAGIYEMSRTYVYALLMIEFFCKIYRLYTYRGSINNLKKTSTANQ